MSVTTEVVVETDGAPEGPVREGGSFLAPLVVCPSAEYGVDLPAIRRQGAEGLASSAGATHEESEAVTG